MDAMIYLSNQKLNVELMFLADEEDAVYCVVRLRPWKGKPHDGQMILAADYDIYTALEKGCKLNSLSAWTTLDWSKRIEPAQTDALLARLDRAKEVDSPLPMRRRRPSTTATEGGDEAI